MTPHAALDAAQELAVEDAEEERIMPPPLAPMRLAMTAIEGEAEAGEQAPLGVVEIIDLAPDAMQAQLLEAVAQQRPPGIGRIALVDIEPVVADIDREVGGAVDPIDHSRGRRRR